MDSALPIGITLFTIALISYTIATMAGVFGGGLKKWHIIVFWLGFAGDSTGTLVIGAANGGFVWNFHSIIGTIALVAMLAQNIGAMMALGSGDEARIAAYPKKVSLPVWVLWVASFVTGLYLARA